MTFEKTMSLVFVIKVFQVAVIAKQSMNCKFGELSREWVQTLRPFYLMVTLETKNGRGFIVSRNIREISTAATPEEEKVCDAIRKQNEEETKKQEYVKNLIDRIAAEIERSCDADCSGRLPLFEKYQDLPTRGARADEQFRIDGSLFLAFANFRGGRNGYKTSSSIYKLDGSTGKFSHYQSINTTGGRHIEYFTIADKHYLAVANRYSGSTVHLNSVIYQWNGQQFVVFQNLPTTGATNFHFFQMLPEMFLAVTNYNDELYPTTKNSIIYKWEVNQFKKFQEIETENAIGSTAFVINSETFIAFANPFKSGEGHSVQSPVYKWTVNNNSFVKVQTLQTYGAHDVKSFNHNDETFLAFANYRNGASYDVDSFLYKWNGSRFVLFQSIPTHGAVAMHPFVICDKTFLGVANDQGETVVYRFSGSQFNKYQEMVYGANDMTSFEYKGHTYLAIAVYTKSGRYNIKSELYKWI